MEIQGTTDGLTYILKYDIMRSNIGRGDKRVRTKTKKHALW